MDNLNKINNNITITKFIAAFQMRDNMKSNKITIKELLESFSLKLELSENILNYKKRNLTVTALNQIQALSG